MTDPHSSSLQGPALPGVPAATGLAASRQRSIARFAVTLLGVFAVNLSSQLVSAAVADIQGGYGLSADEASWLTTAFLVGQLLSVPLAPVLFATLGLRRMVVGLCSLLVATALAGAIVTQPDHATLARFAQGVAAGSFGTGAFAIMFKTFGGSDLRPGLLCLAIATTWPAALGIPIAGPLIDALGWPGLHLLIATIALVALAIAWVLFEPEPVNAEPLRTSDWTGYALFAPAIALFAVSIGQGERHYWTASTWIGLFLLIGSMGLLAFVLLDRANPKAIFRIEVCRFPSVALGLCILLVYRFALQESATLVPRFLTTEHGMRNVDMLGVLGWAALANIVGFLVSLPLVRAVDPRALLGVCFLLMAGGTWSMSLLTADASVPELLVPQLVASAAAGATMLPLMVSMLADMNRPELGPSLGIAFNVVVALGTTGGQAWTTWLLRMREYYHSNELVDAVPATRDTVAARLETLASVYGYRVSDDGLTAVQAAQMLAQEVRNQAYALSFADSFLVLAAVTFLAAGLSALFRGPRRTTDP